MARSRVRIELEGVAELRAALARLDFAALRNAKEAIREAAEEMLGEAQARVPIGETHDLYDSLKVIYLDAGLVASIGTAYFVARFHEFGTVKMPASPFMTPAWEISRPRYLSALSEALSGRKLAQSLTSVQLS